jgi:protocatechuate 3,4-dioxygenase beta subunit
MVITRRRLPGRTGLMLASGGLVAKALAAAPTRPMAMGPFYPVQKPTDADADLVQVAGRAARAAGTPIEVSGRILDRHGKPVPGARIEVWQANAAGRYAHKSDDSSAPLDPNFEGFANLTADRDGAYRYLTIEPGAYRAGDFWRAKHIHYQVDGRVNRLVTQMYFAGDPLIAQDRTLAHDLVQKVGAPVPPVIFARDLGKRPDGVLRLAFDVILIDG